MVADLGAGVGGGGQPQVNLEPVGSPMMNSDANQVQLVSSSTTSANGPDLQQPVAYLEQRWLDQRSDRFLQPTITSMTDGINTAPASPTLTIGSQHPAPPASPAMSTGSGATRQKRRRRLARRRAYNRSHRRHRSSRNLFVSYNDQDNNNDWCCPSTTTTTTKTQPQQRLSTANYSSNNYDINNSYQQQQQQNRPQYYPIEAHRGSEFCVVSEPEPEPEVEVNQSILQKGVQDEQYRPLSARRANVSPSSNDISPSSFFLSNPFAQFINHHSGSNNKYIQLESSPTKQAHQHKTSTSNKDNDNNLLRSQKQVRQNHQFALYDFNLSGSLDSTTTQELISAGSSSGKTNTKSSAGKRYRLAPTHSSHGLSAVVSGSSMKKSPTHSSQSQQQQQQQSNASSSKTNTSFFSSLLGSKRRLEMSTSSNELLNSQQQDIAESIKQRNYNYSPALQDLHSNSIASTSAIDQHKQHNLNLARGSSPAILDKTKRLSKSSMRIELLSSTHPAGKESSQISTSISTPKTLTRYSFLLPSSGQSKQQQEPSLSPRPSQAVAARTSNSTNSLSRPDCSIDFLCREISLYSPPSSSYVLSESAVSQLACIDNVHSSEIFHGAVNESASSISLQQSVSTDPRLYQDDVDIKFSRTLNSCRLPQIRYATKERLFERLTDLRFLSIDFLNTFLLTYRVFATGEEVLEALKNVHYNYDEYIARGQRNQQERIAEKLHQAELKQQQLDSQSPSIPPSPIGSVVEFNTTTTSQHQRQTPIMSPTTKSHPISSSRTAAKKQNSDQLMSSRHSAPSTTFSSTTTIITTKSSSTIRGTPPTIPARSHQPQQVAPPSHPPPPPPPSSHHQHPTAPPPNQLLLPTHQMNLSQKRRSTINALSPITGSTSSSLMNIAAQSGLSSQRTSRETNDAFGPHADGDDTPTLSASPLASSIEQLGTDCEMLHDAAAAAVAAVAAGSAERNRQRTESVATSIGSDTNEHSQQLGNNGFLSPNAMLGADRARSSSMSMSSASQQAVGDYRGRLTLDIPNRPSSREHRAQSFSYVTPMGVSGGIGLGPGKYQQQQQPCEHWRITFRKHLAREEAAQAEADAGRLEELTQYPNYKPRLSMQIQPNHYQQQQRQIFSPEIAQQSNQDSKSPFKLKLDLVAPQNNTTGHLMPKNSPSMLISPMDTGDSPLVPPTTPEPDQTIGSNDYFNDDDKNCRRQSHQHRKHHHHHHDSRKQSADLSSADISNLSSTNLSENDDDNDDDNDELSDQETSATSSSWSSRVERSGGRDENDGDEDHDEAHKKAKDQDVGSTIFLKVGKKSTSMKLNDDQADLDKSRKRRTDKLNKKLRQMSLVKEIDLVAAATTIDSSGDEGPFALKSSGLSSSSSSLSSIGDRNNKTNKSGRHNDATDLEAGILSEPEMKVTEKDSNEQAMKKISSGELDGYQQDKKTDANKSKDRRAKTKNLPTIETTSKPNDTVSSSTSNVTSSKPTTESGNKTNSSLLGAAISSVSRKFRRSSVSAHFAPEPVPAPESSGSGTPTKMSAANSPASAAIAKPQPPPTPLPASAVAPTPPPLASYHSRPSAYSISSRLNTPRSSCQPILQTDQQLLGGGSPVSRAGVIISSRSPRLSARRSSNASALSAFAVATAACDNSMLTHAPPPPLPAPVAPPPNRTSPAGGAPVSTSGGTPGSNIRSIATSSLSRTPNQQQAFDQQQQQANSVTNSRASSRLSSSVGLESNAAFNSSASINQSQLSLLPGQQQQHPYYQQRQAAGSISSPTTAQGIGASDYQSSQQNRKRKSTTIGGGGGAGHQQSGKSARSVATLRVLSVLRHWISKHSQDFVNDPKLSAMTQEFVRDLIEDPRLLSTEHKSAVQLYQMVEKATQSRDQQIDLNMLLAVPPSPTKDSIETLSALEIAEGMTFLDHKIFLAIRSEEFLSQAWMKPDKAIRAPHILLMTKRFNDVSRLVSSEIIRVQDMHRRVGVIEKWTNVAHICRVVHNFNGVLQICAAFTNSAVFRLKKTWDKISKTTRTTIDQLQTLVSTDSRFRNMRDAINRCDPPSIPYVGMYLTDLSFIEEGTPNFAPDGLLNFSKMRMIAHVIREIQHLQKGIYKIDISPQVANYLLDSSRHLTDDEMYRLSLAIEARSASSSASAHSTTNAINQQQHSHQDNTSKINGLLMNTSTGNNGNGSSNKTSSVSPSGRQANKL